MADPTAERDDEPVAAAPSKAKPANDAGHPAKGKSAAATVPAAGADRALRMIDAAALPGGGIKIGLAVPDGATPAYAFEDRTGDLIAARPIAASAGTVDTINLLAASNRDADWAVEASGKARAGRNLDEAWTLAGEDTFFIGTESKNEGTYQPIVATLRDPLTGAATPIKPGTPYRFRLLLATHRCVGQTLVTVADAGGHVLERFERTAGKQFRGGTIPDGYDPIAIDFVAPDGAATLSVSVSKGRTEQRTSSFLFYARPVLVEGAGEPAPEQAVTVSAELLESVRAGAAPALVEAVLPIPDELVSAGQPTTTLTIQARNETIRRDDIAVARTATVEVTKARFETHVVTVEGVALAAQENVALALSVDGTAGAAVTVPVREGAFAATLPIAHAHLDGFPHVVEVVLLPDGPVIARNAAILPSYITPWEALQSHAGEPLSLAASPAASHRYRSVMAWLEAAERDGRALPDLAMLHRELIAGPRKRDSYPPLAFPKVADPIVSVVVPAHDAFEQTYNCLCALLFAFNEVSFEVILVDDASSDATARVETIASNVTVVRHANSSGFVEACNDGAAAARGRYIAFLNNDTEPTARWLDELVAVFDDFAGVGLAGSKLVYPSGKLQEAGGIIWRSGNPWNVGRAGNAADPRYNYLRQVDYVSGAAVLIASDLWTEVGGFSAELAPGYFEDTDLAMKVRERGQAIVYVPTSVVFHHEGKSAGTDTGAGMKRFQEINRPKFKRKWLHLYGAHAPEGQDPEREKDRGVDFRVLFLDQRFPSVDSDAGSYAAFQEIRLLQSLGAKVTFLPRNLAWMDRHTLALERIGVECLYSPFVQDFAKYVRDHARDYDLIYVNRYRIAEQVIKAARGGAPKTKVVLNLADLHFLREMREALAQSPGYTIEAARETREAELAMILAADLTLSYTEVEMAVVQSHVLGEGKIARVPWVVEPRAAGERAFAGTRDILFLGGFGHPPNGEAVRFFASEVLPRVRATLPDARFRIVGSNAPPAVRALASDAVEVVGQVADLDPVFASARVFVAPLLAGAGIKGKVLEAMARGQAIVLSAVAAEGTGLVHGVDCLLARTPKEWAEHVVRLYTDEKLWRRLTANARAAAEARFSFAVGSEAMREALAQIDVFGSNRPHLWYRHALPKRYGM